MLNAPGRPATFWSKHPVFPTALWADAVFISQFDSHHQTKPCRNESVVNQLEIRKGGFYQMFSPRMSSGRVPAWSHVGLHGSPSAELQLSTRRWLANFPWPKNQSASTSSKPTWRSSEALSVVLSPIPWSRHEARKIPSPGLAALWEICMVEFRISVPYLAGVNQQSHVGHVGHMGLIPTPVTLC